MMPDALQLAASFRDPAGFVFERDGELYRQILPYGVKAFEKFIDSGLCQKLIDKAALADFTIESEDESGKVLHISRLPFISYPYEWCFSQLKEAALLTLECMLDALDVGMILKDASAFNIAFHKCRPVFLDHTSFDFYEEDKPWRAYRQFVMHFVAPLLLMKKVDFRCLQLLMNDVGGIPLDLASRLLPWHSWLQMNTFMHIHLHAMLERKMSSSKSTRADDSLPRRRLIALLKGLNDWIVSFNPPTHATEWENYYNDNSYTECGFEAKKQFVREFCSQKRVNSCIDLGANSGVFTRIAAEFAEVVIAADYDARTVEYLFQMGKNMKANIQPLLLDLNNPSPNLGVLCNERDSFFKRTKGDRVLGLALMHHLRITGNWSIRQIVSLFERLAPTALVEFVPLDDVQSQRLLRGREEIYQDWTLENVKNAFLEKYNNCNIRAIPDSGRKLLEVSRVQ